MSTNLRRIKLFFVSVAIVSVIFLLYTIHWNVNIYKFSSEISQVNFADIRIPDNTARISNKFNANQHLAGIRNLTLRYDKPDSNHEKGNETITISSNPPTGDNGKQEVDGDNDKPTNPNVLAEFQYYDDINSKNENTNGSIVTISETETGGVTDSTARDQIKPSTNEDNGYLGVKNISESSENEKVTASENENMKFNDTVSESVNGIELNRNNDRLNDIDKSAPGQVYNNIKNIQFSPEEILSANTELEKVKSRWIKGSKNRKEDTNSFLHVRNQLKQLAYSASKAKVKPPTVVLDTGFDTISISDDDTTSRPDDCESCFKNNFKVLMNEPNLCKGEVDVLILITSSIMNTQNREAIRKTWGKVCAETGSRIKCVFVFGNKHPELNEDILENESATYHDIIKFDFYDVYANLTYKTLSSIRWSHDFCSHAKYVMKTDDDMFVNTELLPFLLKRAPDQEFIGGMCWGPSSPHRDTSSKWFVSFGQYRHSLFPSMCSGTGYVMSRDVANGILRQSPNVPFFYLEDVYVAICVNQLNVKPLLLAGFKNVLVEFEPCVYRNRYITVHGLNGPALEESWKQIQECRVDDLTQSMIYSGFPV